MTGASEDLLQAVYGLRKAAEAQFTGNAYYQAVNEIDNLIECLGWGDSKIRPGDGAAYGFATMIAEMRKLAKAHTSGNQYYAIVVKLDRLESQLAPAARPGEKPAQAAPAAAPAPVAAPVPVAAPAPAAAPAPSAANPTFAALSAASKARVEQVAASLGIVPSHHAAPHQGTEAPAAADWEKRSSEPCAMAELAPVAAAPAAHPGGEPHIEGSPHGEGAHGSAGAVCPFHAMFAVPAGEPASAPVEAASGKSFDELAAASKAQVEHTAVSLGIAAPHTVIAPEAVEALSDRRLESRSSGNTSTSSPEGGSNDNLEAASGQAAPEPHVAETAPDLGSPAAQGEVLAAEVIAAVDVVAAAEAPPPTAQKDEAIRPVEIKRSEPKTLFRLWLDLAFGRKD